MTEVVQPDILHIEACNFVDKPTGGQLNFSRQLIKALGNRLALVGLARAPSEPVGCWFEKEIDGINYKYFAIGRDGPPDRKPLVPGRLTTWIQIKRYANRILSIGIPNIIVREHAILMAMKFKPGYNLCYYFPGVDTPLSVSRYPWAIYLAALFDRFFFESLAQKANCILAAADASAIEGLKHRAGKRLKGKNIISFPTHVDTEIFHPADRLPARKHLGLPIDPIIAITTGRIHWAKGWQFLLDSFKIFTQRFPGSLLVFVGDGAEQEMLIRYASSLGLDENIILTGYKPPAEIAAYLQASNLFVMGSLKEGWSTSLIEALACHIPIVTTKFSSANTIVQHGVNGFVVERDANKFAQAMKDTEHLTGVVEYAKNEVQQYAIKNLGCDLLNIWKLV